MRKRTSVAIGYGLLLWALGGCASFRPAPAEPATLRIADHDLIRQYEDAAAEIVDRKAVTMETLEEQIERPLALPPGPWPAACTDPLSLRDLYARRCSGVLMVLRIYKCPRCSNWHADTEASGFLIRSDGLAVTCRHVIEMDSSQKLDDVIIFGDAHGRVYPVTGVLASSLPDDLALVQLDMRIADSLEPSQRPQPIPLRKDVEVGEPISIISHPDHNHYLLTHGIVSRIGTNYGGISGDQKSLRSVPTPILNVTAEFGAGSSGAPVFDEAGNAVGVVVSTLAISHGEKDSKVQMVVRYCAPVSQLLKLIERRQSATQPSP